MGDCHCEEPKVTWQSHLVTGLLRYARNDRDGVRECAFSIMVEVLINLLRNYHLVLKLIRNNGDMRFKAVIKK